MACLQETKNKVGNLIERLYNPNSAKPSLNIRHNYTLLVNVGLLLFTGSPEKSFELAASLYTNLNAIEYHVEDIESVLSQKRI